MLECPASSTKAALGQPIAECIVPLTCADRLLEEPCAPHLHGFAVELHLSWWAVVGPSARR